MIRARSGRRAVVGLALLSVACVGPTTATDPATQLAAFADAAAAASTEPVVSDLFRSAPYVHGALSAGQVGCTWTFVLSTRTYAPSSCDSEEDHVLIYAVALPDFPHNGGAFLFGVPLVASGEFTRASGCPDGFELRGPARPALIACPTGDPDDWSGMLFTTAGNWTLEVNQTPIDAVPARKRFTVVLRGSNGGVVTLEEDVFVAAEYSESRMEVRHGTAAVVLEGYAGGVGPEYTASRNGRPFGTIRWAGNAHFSTTDPDGGALSTADDQLIRDARRLLSALGRMASWGGSLLQQLRRS